MIQSSVGLRFSQCVFWFYLHGLETNKLSMIFRQTVDEHFCKVIPIFGYTLCLDSCQDRDYHFAEVFFPFFFFCIFNIFLV